MTFARYLAVGGFKAIRDWSLLDLSPRVSVIVGRNGSGKSTIVEALLWTLGEQDLGLLRAESAADLLYWQPQEVDRQERTEREQHLIFEYPDAAEAPDAGGSDRDGGEGAVAYLVLGEESDVSEGEGGCGCCCQAVVEQRREVPQGLITVTRRLGSDGTHAFELDGAPASVEDVQTALARHGLAREVVSVIRQGELERILLAEPPMRAAILAEAAGASLVSSDEQEVALLGLERARLQERIRGAEADSHGNAGAGEGEDDSPGMPGEAAIAETLRAWGVDARLPGGTERALKLLGIASAEGPPLAQERRLLHDALGEVERNLSEALRAAEAREEKRRASLLAVHQRVEQRFAGFLSTLVPGSSAELPLRIDGGLRKAELDIRVAFPDCGWEPLEALSGGQRAMVAFALGLALFMETPARLMVLDEVEPALDDNGLRRFNTLLHQVAETRQVVVVSHQRRTKEVGDVVFGVDVTGNGASMLHFRFEPATKRLIVFGRARGNWLEKNAALQSGEGGNWSGPRSTASGGPGITASGGPPGVRP